ncbi:MAG: DUF1949 domain-containing protein [Spirochaetaceae bacterium]|nr:DUF1949 domain-containing protein [Spirochaetaceae bacterium]
MIHLIREVGGLIVEEVFETGVRLTSDIPLLDLDEFRRNVKDISRGRAGFEVNNK